MQENITARSITLRNENGGWLGQVVLTSDGMFASVTDYGNFSFSWRSIGARTFEEFILGLGEDYFAYKMTNSLSYIILSKKIDKAAALFASKILPALKDYLRKEKIAPQNIAEVGEQPTTAPARQCSDAEQEAYLRGIF